MLQCYPQPHGLLQGATAPLTFALHSTLTQEPPACLPLPIPPHRPSEGWGGSKVGEALASEVWQPESDSQKPQTLWMRQWASVIPTLKWGQEKPLEACSPATQERTDPASGTR